EQHALGSEDAPEQLTRLEAHEARARAAGEELGAALAAAQARLQTLRAAQLAAEERLEEARRAGEAARAELTALEALQAAALSDRGGEARAWLEGSGLAARPRLAAALEVDAGWERAVETALGDYLEALCVARLEDAAASLGALESGRVTLIESG